MTKKSKSVIQAAGGIVWKKEGQEKKLAVVHRHKHNDWSLPKGKVDPEESWKKAALREVLEETGCVAKLKKYAGSISYLLNDKPKVVLFWHMDIEAMNLEKMNGEVDEVRWLTVAEASELLDYQDEIDLIQSGPQTREKGT
ncbi:MAG: NUDIX hydrolase [Anaerolineales bacterium]|nr:NUDIX hydrolase [Anaerolineales bacterium]